MRKRIFGVLGDMFFYVLGSFIYSTAVTVFISANEISPGGFTGIATLFDYLFNVPSGIMLLILNIPIIIIGFIKMGGRFIIKTSLVTFMVSVCLEITDAVFPAMKFDKILAALFGGIMMGTGLGLILLKGATTGGVDIIAKLINRRFPHFTVGRLILLIDCAVILVAAAVYRNIESALYSAVVIYMCSHFMDIILYGADKGRIIYVVTSKPQQISEDISRNMRRGVTHIDVRGGYTGDARIMLMCTVRVSEVAEIYSIIDRHDPSAFTVVSEAGEIIGEGFKNMGK